MRGTMFEPTAKRLWLMVMFMTAMAMSAAARADDERHRGKDWDSDRYERSWRDDRHHYDRHERRRERHHDREHHRHDWDDDYRDRRHWNWHHDWRRDYRRDWHYYEGRYWAPPRYRGRYCKDHRHYHGVHYHVAADDYYSYYYPRYRHYGPRPYGADATVIITVPLF